MGGGDAPDTFVVSHALLNVLGWVGLTVSGTVVTLWPTILRTRADERSHIGAARALPLLSISVVVAALGAAVNVLPLLALGLCAAFGVEGDMRLAAVYETAMPPMVTAGALLSMAGLAPPLAAATDSRAAVRRAMSR